MHQNLLAITLFTTWLQWLPVEWNERHQLACKHSPAARQCKVRCKPWTQTLQKCIIHHQNKICNLWKCSGIAQLLLWRWAFSVSGLRHTFFKCHYCSLRTWQLFAVSSVSSIKLWTTVTICLWPKQSQGDFFYFWLISPLFHLRKPPGNSWWIHIYLRWWVSTSLWLRSYMKRQGVHLLLGTTTTMHSVSAQEESGEAD